MYQHALIEEQSTFLIIMGGMSEHDFLCRVTSHEQYEEEVSEKDFDFFSSSKLKLKL